VKAWEGNAEEGELEALKGQRKKDKEEYQYDEQTKGM
jgi:hypothetical protein